MGGDQILLNVRLDRFVDILIIRLSKS